MEWWQALFNGHDSVFTLGNTWFRNFTVSGSNTSMPHQPVPLEALLKALVQAPLSVFREIWNWCQWLDQAHPLLFLTLFTAACISTRSPGTHTSYGRRTTHCLGAFLLHLALVPQNTKYNHHHQRQVTWQFFFQCFKKIAQWNIRKDAIKQGKQICSWAALLLRPGNCCTTAGNFSSA